MLSSGGEPTFFSSARFALGLNHERVRESPYDKEKELLHSTSLKVREIWDGTQVVRQVGDPMTQVLAYDPTWKPGDAENALTDVQWRKPERAPSLTLNIPNAIPRPWMVITFMCLGLLIQAVVMTINAMIVYHWKWLRAGKVVAAYGYPVWAVGTITMNIGVSFCARVVQAATIRTTIDVRYNTEQPTQLSTTIRRKRRESVDSLDPILRRRVVRLQRKSADLHLPAFAINNKPANSFEEVSIRTKAPDVAAFGTLLVLSGFICQNIGTRELHWSAGILQLGATLLLTLLRAWLRRHVGDPPNPIRLPDEHEASGFATQLAGQNCYILSDIYSFPDPDREISTASSSTDDDTSEYTVPKEFYTVSFIDEQKSKTTDCHRDLVHRIVNLQATIAEIEPERNEITELASKLLAAMEDVLTILDLPKDFCNARFQYMALDGIWGRLREEGGTLGKRLSRSTLEGDWSFVSMEVWQALALVGCYEHGQLPAQSVGSSSSHSSAALRGDSSQSESYLGSSSRPYGDAISACSSLQAMISLTLHHYRDFNLFRRNVPTLRILAHCQKEELDLWKAGLEGLIGNSRDVHYWNRDADGRITNWMQPGSYLILGLPFSSLFKHKYINSQTHIDYYPTHNCHRSPEACQLSGYEIVYESNTASLEEELAIELFSSFLLRLATREGKHVLTKLCKDAEDCEKLESILMGRQLCKSITEARISILPALIASGIIKLPKATQMDGSA